MNIVGCGFDHIFDYTRFSTIQLFQQIKMFFQRITSKIGCCCRPQFQSKTVYYSFRPLFIYSRCFGMMPFSIQTNLFGEVQRVKVTLFDVAWLCMSIAMYLGLIAFVAFGSDADSVSDSRNSHILVLGDRLLFVYGILMCIVSCIMDLINRNRILWNIQRFEAFDKEVNFINRKNAIK